MSIYCKEWNRLNTAKIFNADGYNVEGGKVKNTRVTEFEGLTAGTTDKYKTCPKDNDNLTSARS